jgi:hypothetical protein
MGASSLGSPCAQVLDCYTHRHCRISALEHASGRARPAQTTKVDRVGGVLEKTEIGSKPHAELGSARGMLTGRLLLKRAVCQQTARLSSPPCQAETLAVA